MSAWPRALFLLGEQGGEDLHAVEVFDVNLDLLLGDVHEDVLEVPSEVTQSSEYTLALTVASS